MRYIILLAVLFMPISGCFTNPFWDAALNRPPQQRAMAPQQQGLLLFGSGAALINGMNAHPHQPYQPAQLMPQPMPTLQYQPFNQMRTCTSQQFGHQVYTTCY